MCNNKINHKPGSVVCQFSWFPLRHLVQANSFYVVPKQFSSGSAFISLYSVTFPEPTVFYDENEGRKQAQLHSVVKSGLLCIPQSSLFRMYQEKSSMLAVSFIHFGTKPSRSPYIYIYQGLILYQSQLSS